MAQLWGWFPIRGEDQENITYRGQRYKSRERELEITPDTEETGKIVVREEEMIEPKSREEMAFDSLLRALSDLAKGQKDMLEEIKSQSRDKATPRGFLCGETSEASQPFDHPSPTTQRPSVSVTTRATLPSFVPMAQIEPAREEENPQMGDYFREWQAMDKNFKEALSFRDYCKLKQSERNKGYEG